MKWVPFGNNKGLISREDSTIKYEIDAEDFYLLILLESPHKYEFDPNLPHPLPAQGITGKNLQQELCNVLNNANNYQYGINIIGEPEVYQIALIEPVNYQASEGISTGKYPEIRDSNWIWYFENGFSGLLKRKIQYFLHNNRAKRTIVLNLCTNSTKSELRNRVQECLEQIKDDRLQIYSGQHPCSWHRKNVKPCLH